MNLYGYANGDPVNFSDSFGLCPYHITGIPCAAVYGGVGLVAGGTTGAVVGAAGGTLVLPGFGTVAGAGSLGVLGREQGVLAVRYMVPESMPLMLLRQLRTGWNAVSGAWPEVAKIGFSPKMIFAR